MYPKPYKLLAVLLMVEALKAAAWVAALVSTLPARDSLTLAVIALRAAVSAVQIVSSVLLFENRPPGATLARWAFLTSAGLLTLEIGFRLAPSNLDPTFRWWIVGGYWVYASVAAAYISVHRHTDASRHR